MGLPLQPNLSATEDDACARVATILPTPVDVSYRKFLPLPRLLITGDVHLQNLFIITTVYCAGTLVSIALSSKQPQWFISWQGTLATK
jgi:hypothetical protein